MEGSDRKLFEELAAAPGAKMVTLPVPRQREHLAKPSTPGRPALAAHAAKVEVRFKEVTLSAPRTRQTGNNNLDGQRGKKQRVAGLLTDGTGEPLSIQLYAGNTSDPTTFLDAVERSKVRFGTQEIAVVGVRGMIKALGQAALGEANFRHVTALTNPQVRALLATGVLQLGLFDDQPVEVTVGAKRYVLRCNPQTRARERAWRADQWARVRQWIETRNAAVAQSDRCEPAASLRGGQARLTNFNLRLLTG